MANLILEPFAVVQHWHLQDADGHWEDILAEYLQTLAQRCYSAGPCVIGHIKALALFPDKRFVRVSLVAVNIPANIDGKVPSGCTDLELTLNVLIYGLEYVVIESITSEISNEISTKWKGGVHENKVNFPNQHLPHSYS
jgi:hypothetical protein